ncbi:MAG: restriction endonuclease subunit S [Moraxellaceae bacterium]|uniref:restriction endonuclease subunit S n=1 Tax=Aeromonas salmonicida TaxID=645 RepID=UPI001B78B06B|nr:restriction endonuclease subunit S [Aeromonas salmonicida]MBP8852405.1 restriction endonuclease subunit S [Moraxellaceae bacterium]UUI60527.1 restriction endonuclease subunit S [Aeromonas salmonicida]
MAEQMMQDAAGKASPAGYKQTEVGVIPDDWHIYSLHELANFGGGTTPPRAQYEKYYQCGVHPWVKTLDLNNSVISITDECVTDIALQETSLKLHDIGSVLVAMYGGFNQIGRTGLLNTNAAINQALVAIIPKKGALDSEYLLHNLNFNVDYWKGIASSSRKDPNITSNDVKEFKLPVPTVEEQKAIATAVSDSDALIVSLEQLIAKKQAIKTATMQQLLTGRTRLPQFALRPDGTPKGYKSSELGQIPEDWDVVGFGELFENNIQRQALRKDELVSFVGMQDVSESGQLSSQIRLPFNQVKTGLTYFEQGDVLVAKITPCFENGKGCHTDTLLTEIGYGSTEFHVLRANKCADSKFIYYWTTKSSLRIALEAEMVGSAGHRRVPFSALQVYQIPCPVNKNEQTAIATILSDMDSELTALEQKLAKARDLKQGMMQQLLTGRIRLPLGQIV